MEYIFIMFGCVFAVSIHWTNSSRSCCLRVEASSWGHVTKWRRSSLGELQIGQLENWRCCLLTKLDPVGRDELIHFVMNICIGKVFCFLALENEGQCILVVVELIGVEDFLHIHWSSLACCIL